MMFLLCLQLEEVLGLRTPLSSSPLDCLIKNSVGQFKRTKPEWVVSSAKLGKGKVRVVSLDPKLALTTSQFYLAGHWR